MHLLNLNFTGFSGTLVNSTRFIYGNLTVSTGMTLTAGGNTTNFNATSGTQQITSNGKTLDFPITKDGAGTVQLQDNLTMGSTRIFTLTSGMLDLSSGNRTLSAGAFGSNNSSIRSIAFGTGNITLTGNNTFIFNMDTATNFTYTGTPTVNSTYSGSSGTRSIVMANSAGGIESNVLNFNISAGSDLCSAYGQFRNLNFTGFSGTWTATGGKRFFGNLTISSGMTIASSATEMNFSATGTQQMTSNGVTLDFPITKDGSGVLAFQDALTQGSTRAFTITAGTVQLKNGATSTVGSFVANNSSLKFLQSTTPGSQATLSQASGTVNVVDLTIRDINAIGGASWNAYTDFENTDAGNNDGWNFSLSPPYSTAELPITLRPFTQPRRF
jgi:hypothetical protein